MRLILPRRFSLRTLVIVLPILTAIFGTLWRCGQIDARSLYYDTGTHKSVGYEITVFSLDVMLTDYGIFAYPVKAWINTTPVPADDLEPPHLSVRPWHPWDGRDYFPIIGDPYLAIAWDDPAKYVPAPSWAAVDALLRPWLGDSICDALVGS